MKKNSKPLKELSSATKDFWSPSSIKYLHKPSALEFFREAVSSYTPVIITGIVEDWPAMENWSPDLLEETIGDQIVPVNLTPNGLADAVQDCEGQQCFVYPLEHEMKFGHFLRCLRHPQDDDAVPYLSEQNDNFRRRFSEISNDIPSNLALAKEVFECDLEALNLWIGDERSISSLHKDHFENFYAVIHGEKTFTVLPPTDIAFLPQEIFPTRKAKLQADLQQRQTETTRIRAIDIELAPVIEGDKQGLPSSLPWINLDPEDPLAVRKFPHFALASPLSFCVRAGEILYLPAMWYHRVSQTQLTIAVNYWYEQRFDFRYVFHSTILSLKQNEAVEYFDEETKWK